MIPPTLAHSSVMARISDWAMKDDFLLRDRDMGVNYSSCLTGFLSVMNFFSIASATINRWSTSAIMNVEEYPAVHL